MHYNVRDAETAPSFTGLSEINCKDVLDTALEYHRRGFRVTPLVGKNPILKGWPELELSEDELPSHFFEGRNVGIVLGGDAGLVDVDLDNSLAIEVAEHILPDTLKSGRQKNPRSHWWYLCDPMPASRTYSLPKTMVKRLDLEPREATLVELRSTGRQTAVTPSVHPDGDRYVWHSGEIVKIDGNELEKLVRDVAIAALLALHWPPGARQRLVLCAAGYLGRHMEHGRVEAILEAAAVAAEDEENDKRSRAVRDTLLKLEKED